MFQRNKNKILLFGLITIFVILSLIAPSLLFAGKLDDFEEEATKKEDSIDSPSNESQHNGEENSLSNDSDCDSFVDCFFQYFFELMIEGLYQGGKNSYYQRLHNKNIIGSPILPTISLDTDYQNVESDIYSINNRIEIGFGPFGFQYKELRYFEKDPEDEMKIYQFNYLHRMSDGKSFRVDLGMGIVTLEGNKNNTGLSLLTPVYIFLPKNCSLFLRPNWGWINSNTIQDYKLGFLYSRKYFSFQGGYRFVKSGQETLNGPFIGFNLHY